MCESNEKTGGICILSFDNGGPGTYSQLLILKEYTSRLASDLHVGEDEVYLADYFDLMGGVGFGGMAAFMLGHLRMNIEQAIDKLLTLTDLLGFDDSNGDVDQKKNSNILKDFLENLLQARGIAPETKMNDPGFLFKRSKVTLYAASSANVTHPHAFRTYSSRGSTLNPTIIEALCATTAIQSYFLPVEMGPRRVRESFIGGALGANNPTRLLLEEADKVFGKNRRIAQILSLGCGLSRVQSVNASDRVDIDRLLKEVMRDCDTVANELSTRLFNVDAYLRLNVNRGMEFLEMKDWNTLGAVGTHTATYLATPCISESIDNSLRGLRERVGSVTLGQLSHSSKIKVMAKKAPLVSPYFVLREKPWMIMVDHLVKSVATRQKILPITGMGGCGKTQLVSYFLQEYPTLYAQIVYVDASSFSTIKADFQTWARALGDGHERNTWEDALRVLGSVPPGEQWVLIFDNADDPSLNINGFLPRDTNLTILITSRNPDLGNLATTTHLELGEMTKEEALSAMVQAARRSLPLSDEEIESVNVLLKELGCLAVALVQAGTYCRQLSSTVGEVFRPYSFTQYLNLFKSHRMDLMKKSGPMSLDNYQRGVYITLDLSYRQLTQESRDFLHIISLFHYTDIPFTSFAAAAQNAFEDPKSYYPRDDSHKNTILKLKNLLWQDMGWNELYLQEIIRTLRSFSLVTASSTNDSLFLHLHPLIQAWSRDMISSTPHPYRAMAMQVLTACGNEDIKLSRFLLPHMREMLNQVGIRDMHVNDLLAFGVVAKQQGNYGRAGRILEAALESMKHSAEENSMNTLWVASWLASTYRWEGRWTESEKLFTEVLEQRRRILGKEHPDTIKTASSLAATYRSQGRWTESEMLLVEVLEQGRLSLGIDHPHTIKAARNLAMTYHSQKRWDESEQLLVEVLEQARRVLGIDHLDTIKAAANLAFTYRNQGRWAESEKLELEVLEQRRRILGAEHPDTIWAVAHLASTYNCQGQWAEAEKLEIEVLEQRRRLLGTEHPHTIDAVVSLALTYAKQSRWDEAATLLALAVQQSTKILGQRHPYTQSDLKRLASVYDKLGRTTEAEETRCFLIPNVSSDD
ncbi:hypothetical protein M408DRAFT_332742 [Serendipita vermifera MAFF 305830]|uniref:PNPLA domain-containing protein n=1 Tax=Serendipita vermifera MAFF 305830 TaxID=933852 RepID=A0A0C2WZS3_SERVB|nr:hypothetical protein M408DRAFT_332742 [Serendipita vermifera MAFF 305830]